MVEVPCDIFGNLVVVHVVSLVAKIIVGMENSVFSVVLGGGGVGVERL